MSRTGYRRELCTKTELVQAMILLQQSLSAIEEACSSLKKPDDGLAVGYKPSFVRGVASISSFSHELRTSLAMHQAGSPFEVDPEPKATKKKATKKKSSRK